MYVKNFKQLNKADVALAGGKGASLGEMLSAGIPVPEGFVIISNAFEEFIEENDLNVEIDSILHRVKHEDINSVENASEQIKALILNTQIPKEIENEIIENFKKLKTKYIAVRSSATSEDSASAAWAGQLDSFLNTTEQMLLENVKKCWASLFTPRAIFYRFEKNLSKDKISVAVVVQKMVDSEESGIAFSVHPVTQDKNQIIIEAGFGLGEAIVSGSITPDSYVVDKQRFSILDVNVNGQTRALHKKAKGGNEWKELGEKGKKQVLNEKEIIELSKLIVKIENHYGFPCDIEWAKEKGKFYIVQSRPITTLQKKLETEDEIDFSKYELELEQRNKHTILMSDYWGRALSSTYLEAIKLPIKRIDSIYTSKNKLYVNKKQKEKILDEIEKALNKSDDYIKYVFQATQERLNELDNTTKKISKNLKENSTNEELSSLWKKFDISFLNLVPWYFIPWYITERDILVNKIKNSLLQYQKSIEKITDFNNALMLLISPVKKTSFVKEQEAYYNLLKLAQKTNNLESDAKFIEETKTYLKDFDWTKTFLFLPFQPTFLDEVIQRIKTSLREKEVEEFELKFHQQEKNKKLIENLKEIIKKDKELLNALKLTQELSWLLTASVEDSFFSISRVYPLFEIISKRLKITWGELNCFTSQEIIDLLENKIQIKYIDLEERKKAYIYVLEDNETKYIFGDQAVNLIKGIENQAEAIDLDVEELKGQSANPGKVSGIVKIAKTAQEANVLQKKNILVTTMTSPDYVPAMKKAAAIVTDEGGLLSHAAIISREIGKPCVIGTRNATQVLKDGDLVEVDADKGVIKILKKT